jgi:type I restriction enzyme S subunit
MALAELLLGSVARIIDCEHKTAPISQNEIYAYSVGTRALSQNFIDVTSCKPVNKETFQIWSKRAEIEPGDIVLAREAPVGGVGLVKSSNPLFCLGQRTVLIKPDRSLINPLFLNYFLQSDENQRWFSDMSTGSTVLHINVGDIKKLPLKELPNLQIQTAVADILQNLELRIDSNKRIARQLEEIVQTIFNSWFIDFGPVRAKMAGEKPAGMDDATAALFPDSMEDSELGPIPAGWSVRDFGDVNNLLMGQSPPGDTYNSVGEGVPFYQGRTDFGMRFPKQRIFCTAGTRFAKAGDVLISVRAPVGDLNQAIEDCVIGRGVASALHKSGSQTYSYALLSSLKRKLAYYNGEGTVFGAINRSDFNSLKVVEPLPQIVDLFDAATGSLNDEIRNLFVQTENLIELRDSLLPRLISGELQIPEEMLVS